MERLRKLMQFVVFEFGPLIAFLLLDRAFGIKIAIAGTIAFVVLDGARRLLGHVPFTRVNMLVSTLVLVFGAIDLVAPSPFMLKYEAVITNIATGLVFAAGARAATPLVQELAEQRRAAPFPDRPDVRKFFQIFTQAWACYFFLKAGAYLWLGAVLPLDQAIAVRSLVGGISMGVMLAVSTTQGHRLYFLCHWLGLLPKVAEGPGGA